ncbi:transglycosylase SLT domain-containing protein [Salinisphaera orenii]|uniref:transglycosylase SLT domain-containing protein n=1 Tax=Salinisphaera orenii TaxID=856731 RepID=UPI00195501A0
MKCAVGGAVLMLAGSVASSAALASTGDSSVPAAYVHAADANDVPPRILYALALTESGATLSTGRHPWPWTLNIHGRGVRYASRAAACSALHTALQQTRVVDVGLGQLNVRWQQRLFGDGQRFADPCAALNPYANLDAAAGVLARCHSDYPDSWVAAAGCYHRPAGGAPAQHYKHAFRGRLARLSGDTAPVSTQTAHKTSNPTQRHTEQAKRLTWVEPQRRDGGPHGLD